MESLMKTNISDFYFAPTGLISIVLSLHRAAPYVKLCQAYGLLCLNLLQLHDNELCKWNFQTAPDVKLYQAYGLCLMFERAFT
jgi:hypothetical protein